MLSHFYFRNFPYLFYIILIPYFLLITSNSKGQSNIHGIIVDESNKTIGNANVLLLNAKDSSLIKGEVVSDNGKFSFTSNSTATLIISSSYTGYKQLYSSPFTIDGKKDIDLGTLSFKKNDKQLKEVTIITKKPFIEQKIDRMVINVKNSITSTGSTALEVLERSPGVLVDRQNNAISLSGKNGVVVMINGKINHMPMDALVQMLAGMNSSNIEKIELITTPPANFDAEGNAGFINIVLVQNPSYGTNGSYSATLGYGKGETTMASMNFNHRKGKINLSGDLSFSRVHMPQIFEFSRLINNNGKILESYSINDRNTVQRNYNGRLGFDFQASKKTLIGAEITAYDNRWSMDAKNDNTISINKVVDTVVHAIDNEINRWSKYGASLNVQQTIRENETIVFEYDFDHYIDNNPNYYLNSYYNGQGNFLYDQKLNSGKLTPITINVMSSDYTKKISKSIELSAGVKYSTYRFTNDVAVARSIQNQWVKDNDFTAKYYLKEDIPAVYTSFSIAVNEKNSIKAGLRYEYTVSNLGTAYVKNIVDRKYGKLFPSLFISHKINDNNSINFSFSKRITRPTFRDLAPFVYFLDPNTFISGNSALQPSTSNSANIAYSHKRFLFSVSYSDEKDFIASFQSRVDPATNKQYLIAENEPDMKTAGTTISLPFTITKWWNMQNNFSARWQRVEAVYNNQPLTLQQENFNIVSTQTFKLPKDYSFELQGFYSSKQLAGTYILKPLGALNIGIQKKLSGQKGKLSFNVSDVFNSLVAKLSVNLPSQNLVTNGSLRFSQRTFALTYSKNFGSNEIKANRNKSAASEEERKRVE
jgi:outer membrane receptor protein involved in Fe transport